MTIDVRLVTLETRRAFAAIVEEANEWQLGRGSEGWTSPFNDEWLIPRIERNELFLAYRGTEPVSCFRLLLEDKPFWGDREVGDSIYLHTFAVKRDRAGSGLGTAVIEWVAARGRELGRQNVRLDCFAHNTGLIAFYERNGFTDAGETIMKGRVMKLMERPI